MNYHKFIDDGLKFLKKGEFLEAIDSFQEALIYDKNNYLIYYYLSLAYIFREDYDTAYNYIRKAYDLNSEEPDILNTIAFLQLKFNNINEAINYWLDILDIEPSYIFAKRNLEKVRKSSNVEKLSKKATPEDFINLKIIKKNKFLSRLKININLDKRITISLVILLIPILLFFILRIIKIPMYDSHFSSIKNIKINDLKDDYLIDKNIKKSLFRFNKIEIKKLFKECKKYIKDRRFNKAIIIINKILHSNANINVKEKFKILKTFIPEKVYNRISDKISYSTIMNFPTMYRGVFIDWYGKIEDLELKKSEINFNMIIKEDNISIGVAKVFFKKRIENLHNEEEVEIKGKFLKLDDTMRMPVIEAFKIIKKE